MPWYTAEPVGVLESVGATGPGATGASVTGAPGQENWTVA
jgi:hypothetical protein